MPQKPLLPCVPHKMDVEEVNGGLYTIQCIGHITDIISQGEGGDIF